MMPNRYQAVLANAARKSCRHSGVMGATWLRSAFEGAMMASSPVLAAYSDAAARDSYKHFPILSFPALFVLLVSTAAFMYWLFRKKR